MWGAILLLTFTVAYGALAQEQIMTYRQALEKTDPSRIEHLLAGSAAEQVALDRFVDFVSEMSPATMRQKVSQVYATDAYFNDTLKEIVGAEVIEEYMVGSMEATESVQVVVDDIAGTGGEYYVRWTMDIRFKKYNDGKIARSVGISHLRFNASGKVVLHKDYWDAAGGLYEYLPLVGSMIRWIKGQL